MKNKILVAILAFSSCGLQNTNNGFTEEEINGTKIGEAIYTCPNNSSTKVLDLDAGFEYRDKYGNNMFWLEPISDTIKFLPLETTDESIFSSMQKVRITDSRIYIMDRDEQLLIFDINGKYINKLKIGQGPGEISWLVDFAYDQTKKQLVVCNGDFFYYYDPDGNYINCTKCPIWFQEFNILSWGYVLFDARSVNTHLGNDGHFAVFVTDDKMVVHRKSLQPNPNGNQLTMVSHYLQKYGDELIISYPGRDTIFSIDAKGVNAKYVVKYEDYKMDVQNEYEVETSTKYYHTSGYLENSQTQIFRFSQKNGGYTIIRDKKTGKVIGGESAICKPEEVPNYMGNVRCVHNDYFVTSIPPENNMHFTNIAISEAENAKIANLTEEDNEILVFFKLKELK